MKYGVLVLACVSVLLFTESASASPCTAATGACTEWIAMAGNSRLLIYRSYALDAKNDAITRALIMIHGAGRDADNYFRHVLAAAFLAGALDDTVVISPRFASKNGNACQDVVAERELQWQCNGPGRWTGGGAASDNSTVTSFDAIDEILGKLARKDMFPNLRAIVVAGHSAGGQFVSRYEMANQVHDRLGIPITYVVANPSSYAYVDNLRPSATAVPPGAAAAAPGYVLPLPDNPPAPFVSFSDARNCTTYDNWPYGFQKRVGYSAGITADRLKQQLAERPTTYLLGGLDILPLFGFDGSCSAMAQGSTRLARGLAFARYVNDKLAAQHKTVVIPACGHNARCMVTADAALALIFPKR